LASNRHGSFRDNERASQPNQITHFLSEEESTSKDLWQEVRASPRKTERDEAVLIFDDAIQEKPIRTKMK
jgi:hypothetical protein